MNRFLLTVLLFALLTNLYAQNCTVYFSYTIDQDNNYRYYFVAHPQGQNYSYLWKFSDGVISTEPQPVHIFTAPGKYSVSLTITDDYNNCSANYSSYLFVGCEGDFIPSFYTVIDTNQKTVSFINNSKYNSEFPTYFMWNFGDGDTSMQKNPIHTYSHPGVYKVNLTLDNELCVDSITKVINTRFPDQDTCKAMFSFISQDTLFDTFSFVNLSDAPNDAYYFWDFGDGITYQGYNAIHQYMQDGIYKVVLKVNSVFCNDSVQTYVYTGQKAWYPDTPQAFFSLKPVLAKGLTYKFYDFSYSQDTLSARLWDFGDNSFSTYQNPTHTFPSDGLYIVKLKIYSQNTDSTVYKILFPAYTDSTYSTTCSALFFPEINNLTVHYHDISIGQYSDYHWYFGIYESDDHDPVVNYDDDGIHEVAFAIFNGNNNCSSMYKMWLDLTTGQILYGKPVPIPSSNNYVAESKISIFPNPVHDRLVVINAQIDHIQLYNAVGKLIPIEFVYNNNVLILNTEHLIKGVYFLRIYSKGSVHNFKVIKN